MPNEWRPGMKFYEAVWEQDGEPMHTLAIHAADEADVLARAEVDFMEHPEFDFPGRAAMTVRISLIKFTPPTIGDRVEVIAVPDRLPPGMGTRALFEACVGRTFAVVGVENGLLELEVGDVVGEQKFMHSIWIEPECIVRHR